MNESSGVVKNKQQRNLLIVISMVVLGLLGLYWLIDSHTPQLKEQKKMESVSFASPTDHIHDQSVWMERAQNDLKEEQQKTIELNKKVEQLQSVEGKKSLESDPHYVALEQQVEVLKKTVEGDEEKNASQLLSSSNVYHGPVFQTTPGAVIGQNVQNSGEMSNQIAGIDDDELTLKPLSVNTLPKKNSDTFVPAGTYAEAIMLGAADASAGVTSQSQPVPTLFRLIAEGTLPNHQKSHLKNCVAIGAVTGDISSERGAIRIERLSCTFSNGEIVEQVVEGTIFGMDAKNGIRGNPVWRESALLGRAAVAGSLSGFANGISQTFTTNSISPLGSTQTIQGADILKVGAAQGAANAMEKLADYNIKRAEQYHPVIQISAGQPVDIVFLKGFYLDGKKHDDLDQDHPSQPELFPESTIHHESGPSLTLSEQQLEKIKQHENAFVTKSEYSGDTE